ncbi:MAG TPA: hypothetical protein DCQ98_22785 [Planctomycetaceae bacterium]|nr:hypothetical protein [Planctomycetaceae bacterium]HRF00001.1 glycosyltransferase family 4 protein [Pirellulaceae bacterium]
MRIAMVTRRFWPLVGGAEMAMANLASEFRDRGHRITLLTARWEPSWPSEIRHRDIPVVRLAQPRGRGWGTFVYLRALTRRLVEMRDEVDLVFVSMLKHDAYAAVASRHRHHLPVVIRAEGGGATGDCHWHEEGRFGRRIRRTTTLADAHVAPSPAVADEMIAAGYDPRRLRTIENGVPVQPERRPEDRRRARAALSELHPALVAADHEPLAVYTGRLHPGKGLAELVDAWPAVLRRRPEARLWLVGEGEFERELRMMIRERELQEHVLLPGTFDDVGDVLSAADLFVLPSHHEGLSLALLEAMAAELPVVATEIPGNCRVVRDGVQGKLVPVRDPGAIAAAVLALLDDPEGRLRMGRAARRTAADEHSIGAMASAHLELFEQVLSSREAR